MKNPRRVHPAAHILPLVAGSALLLLGASTALADTAAPVGGTAIFEGESVQACGWPTAVAVTGNGSLCTGTLIHPRVVVYAAHCGGGRKTIRFSETSGGGGGGASVPADCVTNPSYAGTASDQANDHAFCVLDAEVNLPLTPVVMGCETSILQSGTEVALVGFGNNSSNETGAGRKRWRMSSILDVFPEVIRFPSPSVCSGDSGGPAFVRYPDGGWRVFGIASTVSGGCGGSGTHARIDTVIPWIEETSGIDVTPCHDAEGNWDVTPDCAGFYAGEPSATGTGTWQNGCEGTPVSGSAETCGPAFDAEPDDVAPTVTIVNPGHLEAFESGAFPGVVEVEADDVGHGVREVKLEINGELQDLTDNDAPYSFNASFPDGIWEIVAVAEDFSGNVGRSELVVIGIGETPVEPTEDGESDSDSDSTGDPGHGESGDDGGDDPGASPDENDGESKASCSVSPTGGPDTAGLMLGMFVLAWGRRRR